MLTKFKNKQKIKQTNQDLVCIVSHKNTVSILAIAVEVKETKFNSHHPNKFYLMSTQFSSVLQIEREKYYHFTNMHNVASLGR
jgi:hypothetical protein